MYGAGYGRYDHPMDTSSPALRPVGFYYLLAVGILAALALLDVLGVFEALGPGNPF